MSYAARLLAQHVRRVLYTQAVLTLVVAAGFFVGAPESVSTPKGFFSPDWYYGLSASYGGAVAMLSAWWLGRGVNAAGELAREHPGHGVLALYSRLFHRLFGTIALMAIAFAALRLAMVPVVAGFAAAQLGYAANARRSA